MTDAFGIDIKVGAEVMFYHSEKGTFLKGVVDKIISREWQEYNRIRRSCRITIRVPMFAPHTGHIKYCKYDGKKLAVIGTS